MTTVTKSSLTLTEGRLPVRVVHEGVTYIWFAEITNRVTHAKGWKYLEQGKTATTGKFLMVTDN